MTNSPQKSPDLESLREFIATLKSKYATTSFRSEVLQVPFVLDFSKVDESPLAVGGSQLYTMMHREHFVVSSLISLVYSADAYLSQADAGNPIGIFSGARTLLELDALVYFVFAELRRVLNSEQHGWRERGQQYFDIIVRARLSTRDPLVQEGFEVVKFPKVKCIHVNDGIRALTERPESRWAQAYYDGLCDFVHPNWGSRLVGVAGTGTAHAVNFQGKLILASRRGMGVVAYRYPSEPAGEAAVAGTVTRALANAKHVLECLGEFPTFSVEELHAISPSDEAGAAGRAPSAQASRKAGDAVGRNAPCPCGSGRKYKKCHGQAN